MWKKDGLLYLILDRDLIQKTGRDIFHLAEIARKEGVFFLQYRFKKDTPTRLLVKEAGKISKIIRGSQTKLIINDRLDICITTHADGVHLGEEDMPVELARGVLKREIIGKTIHFQEELTKNLFRYINYISLGPVFKTALKPHLKPLGIKKVQKIVSFRRPEVPVFLIGGITISNVNKIVRAGFRNIAVARSIILSDNPEETIRRFKKYLGN